MRKMKGWIRVSRGTHDPKNCWGFLGGGNKQKKCLNLPFGTVTRSLIDDCCGMVKSPEIKMSFI